MDEKMNLLNNCEPIKDKDAWVQLSEELFLATDMDIRKCNSISMPIAQLSTLGSGVASLLPTLRTVTQTTTINSQGLYRVANAGVGDALKVAKDGNFWGAMKTAKGASKMAKFQAVKPITATTKAVTSINPATMMMAVALFSIEQELGNIADMEKQIISFLEVEKEAEIEADIRTLSTITSQYKFNWDNECYVGNNHKMVLDIQRTARKNMIAFQKQVSEAVNAKKIFVAQNMVNSSLNELMKRFNYYRLSLFAFSMASLLEVMLSGNFKEEYLMGVKQEIESNSVRYRELYGKGSVYLEKISGASVEANLLKGIGTAGSAVGKFIGKIPVAEKGPVDEFLQEKGENLKKNARNMEQGAVGSFAALSNPGTAVFVEKIGDMVRIYNHTESVCFDNTNIYLVTD